MRFAELATRAALGTTGRPVTAADLPDAVAATLPDPQADPAVLLLDAAASYVVVRAAEVAEGPAEVLELPAPSSAEAPPPAVAVLRRVCGPGWTRAALPREALVLLAERGLTLPPDLVVDALRDLSLPATPARLIGAVLDARGWALASLNPEWATRLNRAGAAESAHDDRLWEEGTLSQRVQYLAAIRRADPAAGRAKLLALAWKKETAEAREALVSVLAEGLSAADEGFLEAALDDRAKTVRSAAATLLATLPASAFLRRAEALAAAHITRHKRLLRPDQTVARGVPQTAATTRDGYPAAASDTPALARLRLAHAVSLVPPLRWPEVVGATASQLAAAPIECDGALDLTRAWAVAAERWRDADLARTLLAQGADVLSVVGSALPDAEAAAVVARALRGSPASFAAVAGLIPSRLSGAWVNALADVVEAWLARTPTPWQLGDLARRLGEAAPPELAAGLAARLQALAERTRPEAIGRRVPGDATATLHLRGALYAAVAPYPIKSPHTIEEGRS